MLKRISYLILLFIIILLFISPVVASEIDTNPKDMVVSYVASETDWTWSVPTNQSFSEDCLEKVGVVSLSPAEGYNNIVLQNGTQIKITLNSDNNFNLINTENSQIPYEVTRYGVKLNQNDTVLSYISGMSGPSASVGIERKLKFVTTNDNIKNAKIAGTHSDTITFTLNILPYEQLPDEDDMTTHSVTFLIEPEDLTDYNGCLSVDIGTFDNYNTYSLKDENEENRLPETVSNVNWLVFAINGNFDENTYVIDFNNGEFDLVFKKDEEAFGWDSDFFAFIKDTTIKIRIIPNNTEAENPGPQ